MKVYVVVEKGYEYDDEYYRLPESDAVNIKDVYSSPEDALKRKNDLEEEFFGDFRIGDFDTACGVLDYSDNPYGVDYDTTLKKVRELVPAELFTKIVNEIGMYEIKVMDLK